MLEESMSENWKSAINPIKRLFRLVGALGLEPAILSLEVSRFHVWRDPPYL